MFAGVPVRGAVAAECDPAFLAGAQVHPATPDLHAFDVGRHESQLGSNMDLEHAIAGLPSQARIIFVLHDVEGYRHEEIAEQMGLAVGTSKAQLHRARRILREVLEQ